MKGLDQYVVGVEENDDIRLTRFHAAAAADISATSSIQIIKSGARSTSSRKKKAKASKSGPTSGMRSKVQAALADQASLLRIDNKSFHDVHRAEGVLGTEHPSTLGSMNDLALVLSSQGKYEEAEEMHGQALALRERVLGKEHPDTLTSVYCLAYLLHHKKRYKDADVFYHRAYSGYRKTLGEKHPTTAACSRHYSSMLKEEKDQ